MYLSEKVMITHNKGSHMMENKIADYHCPLFQTKKSYFFEHFCWKFGIRCVVEAVIAKTLYDMFYLWTNL